MSIKRKFRAEPGVSETIGFIIIFGIVMTGIAIVTLYGYPALLQEQQNANVKNMEKNMLVLQSDVRSLTFKSVPYQETSIQVSGGTLLVKPPSSLSYFQISNQSSDLTPPISIGQILYESSDNTATIALENGAIHIRYWNTPGSAMLSTPQWFYDTSDPNNKTYVIQLITLNGSSYLAQTGIGRIQLALDTTPGHEPSQITHDISSGENITITYAPDPDWNYRVAWKNYFNSADLQMKDTGSAGDDVVFTLDSSANKLIIKRYNVTVLSL
jgi:hypothetical protein